MQGLALSLLIEHDLMCALAAVTASQPAKTAWAEVQQTTG